MKRRAAHQTSCDLGGLLGRALGRSMSCEITCHGDEDVPALSRVAPLRELSHPGLKHLVRMESGIFAQQGLPERRDESLRPVAEHEMARDQPGCSIDLPLAVECIEQGGAECV